MGVMDYVFVLLILFTIAFIIYTKMKHQDLGDSAEEITDIVKDRIE